MPQPSPAVDRAVSILELLADAGTSYSLSEIARRLDLSKASCQNLLAALTDRQCVVRNPHDLTFSLGPTLVTIGQAALARLGLAEVARPAMEAVSARHSLECIATEVQGDAIVVLARSGPPRAGASVRVGERIPFAPPFGSVFLAWGPESDAEAWLERAEPPLSASQRRRCVTLLQTTRRLGYSLALEGQTRQRLGHVLLELAQRAEVSREVVAELLANLRDEEYELHAPEELPSGRQLTSVSIPVFDARQSVPLALTLHGFPEELTGLDLPGVLDSLIAAAREVCRTLGGRVVDGFAS